MYASKQTCTLVNIAAHACGCNVCLFLGGGDTVWWVGHLQSHIDLEGVIDGPLGGSQGSNHDNTQAQSPRG